MPERHVRIASHVDTKWIRSVMNIEQETETGTSSAAESEFGINRDGVALIGPGGGGGGGGGVAGLPPSAITSGRAISTASSISAVTATARGVGSGSLCVVLRVSRLVAWRNRKTVKDARRA